jgi:RNA polymerase sigma-70 factor, ECF subfamily
MSSKQTFPEVDNEELIFRQLFEKHYEGLVRFALSYLHDKYLAENIVQESFVTLWEKRTGLAENYNVKSFLVIIVKNKCINHLETSRNRLRIERILRELSLREIDIDLYTLQSLDPQELFKEEIEHLLEAAIDELPYKTRKVFMLSRMRGDTNREIARQLNITEKGVEFHMTKALKALHIKLRDYLPLLLFLFQ